MWACRLERPGSLAKLEVDPPRADELAEGEVLLDVVAGGLCGSDIPYFTGVKARRQGEGGSLPGEIGVPLHEVVGVVAASRSDDVRVGQRVVGWASRSNGLAQQVITRGDRLWEWAAPVSAVQAVVAQPLACVLEAMARVDVEGRDVAVIGLGPIGLLFAHVASHSGAAAVVGIDPVDRSGLAGAFGLDQTVTVASDEWSRSLAGGRPQVVVEAVGHQADTLQHALSAVADEGTVLCFGIPDEDVYPVDIERIMRGGLTLVGAVTRRHRTALRCADEYLIRHPELPSRLISHQLGRHEAQAAYELAARWASDRVKVVLDLGDE